MSSSNTSDKATWSDYLELTKPKVVLLILLTAVVGMYMAPVASVPIDVLILDKSWYGTVSLLIHVKRRKNDEYRRKNKFR